MTYAGPQHYHVKVRVYNESIDFGKGVAELLQRIEATGSLSAAYKAMGMSASKAWKILRRAEADLGFALVSSTAGGKSGGSSVLTPEGRLLLERYTAFNAERCSRRRHRPLPSISNNIKLVAVREIFPVLPLFI